MVHRRWKVVIFAGIVSLALLGASFMNLTSIRSLRLALSNTPPPSEEPSERIGLLEDDIEKNSTQIAEEMNRYGTFDKNSFLEFVERILGIFAKNTIAMIRLDIQERNGIRSLDINGEGQITDILQSLEELQDLENLLVIENLTISEERELYGVSMVIQPALVPDIRETEVGISVYHPERMVTETPSNWARHLFGYRPPIYIPRPVTQEPIVVEEEPSAPSWLVYIGRFRADENGPEYAFRDDRDGRIRILSLGELRQGWQLIEYSTNFVSLEIEGRQYKIEVSQ